VKSLANSDASQAQLGADNGPGFGWHDIDVVKAGVDYDVNPAPTARSGYNHGGVLFGSSQAFFNLLAPAVTKDHLHVGATQASDRVNMDQPCAPSIRFFLANGWESTNLKEWRSTSVPGAEDK
jgi:long-chain fatty acid transport protein